MVLCNICCCDTRIFYTQCDMCSFVICDLCYYNYENKPKHELTVIEKLRTIVCAWNCSIKCMCKNIQCITQYNGDKLHFKNEQQIQLYNTISADIKNTIYNEVDVFMPNVLSEIICDYVY